MLDSIITAIWNRVLDGIAVFSDYAFIGEVWVGVAILVLVAGYIAVMVPWQWVRGALGYVVSIAIAVATGMQLMFNRERKEKVEREARQAPKEDEHKDRWF